MAASIWSRKLDMVYLAFFIIHIPVMFLIDLYSLYPTTIRPDLLDTLRTFYISTYRDRFFTEPPAWFGVYIWIEALYHLPLSIWAIGALVRDDPLIPLHLLVWACETALTTLTCVAEYLSWPDYSTGEKLRLGGLYVPYLALAVFMGVDMFGRLHGRLSGQGSGMGVKKVQ